MADNDDCVPRTLDPAAGMDLDLASQPDPGSVWEPRQPDAGEPDEAWGSEPDEIARRRALDIRVAAVMRSIGYDVEHLYAKALMEQLRAAAAGSLVEALKAGDLYTRAAKLGTPYPPPEPASWRDEARAAVNEAPWSAAQRFVQGPLRGWDASKGTSIATFFTNYVIGSDLKTRYCALQRQEARIRGETSLDEVYADGAGIHLPDPRDDIACLLDGLEAEHILRQIDPDQAALLRRVGDGDHLSHIARDVDIPPKTLARQIRRLQKQLSDEHNPPTEGGGR